VDYDVDYVGKIVDYDVDYVRLMPKHGPQGWYVEGM